MASGAGGPLDHAAERHCDCTGEQPTCEEIILFSLNHCSFFYFFIFMIIVWLSNVEHNDVLAGAKCDPCFEAERFVLSVQLYRGHWEPFQEFCSIAPARSVSVGSPL
jgi:hypothetical protein